MMTGELQINHYPDVVTRGAGALPPVPWRDPHTVSKEDLRGYIAKLEQACLDNPLSADLRTCLGMAHAMNFDVYKSMDALEEAVQLDPESFWAQMKKAELLYRIRALPRAEQEMLAALELANTGFEASIARKHLLEIRRLMREGTQKPAWTKSLRSPVIAFALIVVASISALMMVTR